MLFAKAARGSFDGITFQFSKGLFESRIANDFAEGLIIGGNFLANALEVRGIWCPTATCDEGVVWFDVEIVAPAAALSGSGKRARAVGVTRRLILAKSRVAIAAKQGIVSIGLLTFILLSH